VDDLGIEATGIDITRTMRHGGKTKTAARPSRSVRRGRHRPQQTLLPDGQIGVA
jgi:hypothetical protein